MFEHQIANETVGRWSQLGDDNVVELQEEFLLMTIKGITRTCFGSAFNDEEEIHKITHLDHQVLINMYSCNTT